MKIGKFGKIANFFRHGTSCRWVSDGEARPSRASPLHLHRRGLVRLFGLVALFLSPSLFLFLCSTLRFPSLLYNCREDEKRLRKKMLAESAQLIGYSFFRSYAVGDEHVFLPRSISPASILLTEEKEVRGDKTRRTASTSFAQNHEREQTRDVFPSGR